MAPCAIVLRATNRSAQPGCTLRASATDTCVVGFAMSCGAGGTFSLVVYEVNALEKFPPAGAEEGECFAQGHEVGRRARTVGRELLRVELEREVRGGAGDPRRAGRRLPKHPKHLAGTLFVQPSAAPRLCAV